MCKWRAGVLQVPARSVSRVPSDEETTMTMTLPAIDTDAAVEAPTACAPHPVGDGITVLPAYLPVPGYGVLPANAFLVDGPEPLLVDAGPGGAVDGFRAGLARVTDPTRLRWLWLTHTDPDHIGSLQWLLDVAPDLKVVTTFLAVGKLSMIEPVPLDRVLWVNPGTSVELNGRVLHALRPPTFDAPETTAVYDEASGTLFSADTFGALLDRPVAEASAVEHSALTDGMRLWSTIDSPWVTHTDGADFRRRLDDLRRLGATRVLGAHLPPVAGPVDPLLDVLDPLPGAPSWVGPDQAALDAMLAATTA